MKLSKCLTTLCVALSMMVSIGATVDGATIGAGIGVLEMDGANNAIDTASDGTTDQSRQNLDDSFTATFGAGEYTGTNFSFRAGQTGSVIPYIAKSTGADTYEILAVGSQVDVGDADIDVDKMVSFGGDSFMLTGDTELFAGITNPAAAGSQNPVYTNLASGATVDHDNNADGMISPAVVGGAVDGFGHANLARSYAFAIDVEAVPEPSTLLMLVVAAGLAVIKLRR